MGDNMCEYESFYLSCISNDISCILSYEKMISDKYLGKVVCHALKDLIKKRELFKEKSFDELEAFELKYLCFIESGYVMSDITYKLDFKNLKWSQHDKF